MQEKVQQSHIEEPGNYAEEDESSIDLIDPNIIIARRRIHRVNINQRNPFDISDEVEDQACCNCACCMTCIL